MIGNEGRPSYQLRTFIYELGGIERENHMDEDKVTKSASGFLGSIFPFLAPEIRAIIGVLLAFIFFWIVLNAFVNTPAYFKNLVASSPKAPEFCWELREVQGRILKFNKCTGEANLVILESVPIAKDTKSDVK
jgi:hypothetical protein